MANAGPMPSELTPEAKRDLLAALLADRAAAEPGPFAIDAGGTRFYVYRPPTNARADAERAMSACGPEERAELLRRAADPDPRSWLTADEVLRVTPEDADRIARSREPSA